MRSDICSLVFFPVGLLQAGAAAATIATDATERLTSSRFLPLLLPPLREAPPGTEREMASPFFCLLISLSVPGTGQSKGAGGM